MKRIHILSVFVVALGVFFGVSTSVYAQSDSQEASVKSAVLAVEQRENVSDKTIYTNVTHRRIMQLLEGGCSESAIEKAETFLDAADQILTRKYATMQEADILLNSYELYNLVADLNLEKVNDKTGNQFCTLKHAMNGLMRQLRKVNLDIVTSSGIINDFNEGTDELEAAEIKLATLVKYNREYAPARIRLGEQIKTRLVNPSFTDSLTDDENLILQQVRTLMVNMIAHSLLKFKDFGLFTQEDIRIVADKVKFEFVSECRRFNGRYEVIQTVDHLGELIETETTGVHFKVNYCPSYFVIRDLPEIFEKIVTHELAHHFYYYKDDNPENFENICWSDTQQRNTTCDEDDFVSDYAQVASVEDYAEHFMYRFLDLPLKNTPILEQKTQYFETYNQ